MDNWKQEHQEIAYQTFRILHSMLQTDLDSELEKELKKVGINYSKIIMAESFFDIQRNK